MDKFEAFLKSNLAIVGGVGIGIAFIQVCKVVFVHVIFKNHSKQFSIALKILKP